MRILIDMDGVITDLETHLQVLWTEKHPDSDLFEKERTSFYIGTHEDSETSREIYAIMHSEGFFAGLPPMQGAITAVRDMFSAGHEVFIVTSAGISYPFAATEKYRWVEEHFGRQMISHLIITPAKYTISGDVLIDDKPEIHREEEADWEHVLYDATYNRHVSDRRRLTWKNWRDILTDEAKVS